MPLKPCLVLFVEPPALFLQRPRRQELLVGSLLVVEDKKQGVRVDPRVQAEINRKRKADEDRWFKGGTFTQIPNTSGGTASNGGFKVPAPKKVDNGDGKMAPPPLPLKEK